jgi:hypothetical protein
MINVISFDVAAIILRSQRRRVALKIFILSANIVEFFQQHGLVRAK